LLYLLNPPLDKLEQGDILKRTKELDALIAEYHPYYAQKADNKFFAVLTQSCDLVPRQGGSCKARYISLAPVRPLKSVLKREFEGKLENVGPGRKPFAPQRVLNTLEQFLERLFNNNEPSFFYYEVDHGCGIYEEMCAMLALPISLKPEHYETLRAGKLAGIADVFQAKLGWLIGQMYSRVGTPDLERDVLRVKVKSYLDGLAVWVTDDQAIALRGLVAEHAAANGGAIVGAPELAKLVKKVPRRKTQVLDVVLEVAQAQGLVQGGGAKAIAFRRALEEHPVVGRILS
jgi:hypothetical protein